jgi:uncharacterized membrane protein YebE (DUF533 family)
MWWTTLAIGLVATYFEWSYRKRKKVSKETDPQPPADSKPVTSEHSEEMEAAQKEVS